ncbi:hypothetical protein KAR91_68395 [Candidatus Pacearchaeota archaeon]|nr:hypothetical protein [Candidatus Pacearchaeota archaeon]
MKVFKIIIIFILIGLVAYLVDSFAAGGLIMAMPITGGPFRDFTWGGQTLRPSKDGEAEIEYGDTQYEPEQSPNGDVYSTAESIAGYVQQECIFTAEEFKELKGKQDGAERSGTATLPNGDVVSMNGLLAGEVVLAGGKATIKIAGKVRLQ